MKILMYSHDTFGLGHIRRTMALAQSLLDKGHRSARKLKIRIFKFHRKMEKIILTADCVVSMGGYNTMCEIVSAARPMLIIPRSTPREEQLMRARIFAARGLLEYIPWETVTVPQMRDKLGYILEHGMDYEQRLSGFPMTAFDVINSRIGKIGLRSVKPACHGHEVLWMPDYYGHVRTQ